MEILAAVGMKYFVFPIYFQFQSRHCRYVSTNIWEMSGSWVGVGCSCKHPYYKFAPTQPLSDSLSPLSSPYQFPKALIPYENLRPILGISWAYNDHIFAYILGLSHFLNTFNTLSQLVHHSCKTPPKQYCEVISIHAYTPPSTFVQLFLLPQSAITLV